MERKIPTLDEALGEMQNIGTRPQLSAIRELYRKAAVGQRCVVHHPLPDHMNILAYQYMVIFIDHVRGAKHAPWFPDEDN